MVRNKEMTYAQKLQSSVLMYLKKVTKQPAFVNKKPSKEYWITRKFLFKQEPDTVTRVYEYLSSQEEFDFMTVYDLLKNAKKYQVELRWNDVKSVGDAKPAYSFNDILAL